MSGETSLSGVTRSPDRDPDLIEHHPTGDLPSSSVINRHHDAKSLPDPTSRIGGRHYRPDLRPRPKHGHSSRGTDKAGIESAWLPKRTIAGIPYNSSIQHQSNGYRQLGAQPGDDEWEATEANWEKDLTEEGFEAVMEKYGEKSPDKLEELRYGPRSMKIRPARGDDEYAAQFNHVLKNTIPTVAFKLTQQQFGRPVSPLNFQEPNVRGQEPKDWARDGVNSNIPNDSREIVYYEDKKLGFLDYYNEKSHGQPMLRRRNPISEAHIQRVEPKPRLQSAFPSYDGGSDLKVYDADEYLGLLIQSEGGALHLPDDMYSTFRRLAQRLLDLPLTGTDSFYVDIKEPGSQVATPYEIVDGDEGEATYRENIRTLLQDLNVEVRVRTGKIDRTRPFTNKDINSEYIQLTDAKVGYRWLRADWNENGKALLNSQYFVQNVRCLYPYAKNPKRNVNDVTIAIPGGPSFDINIEKNDQDNLADLHKIFSQLMETKRASKTDSEPLLISISKKGEPPLEVQKGPFRTSPKTKDAAPTNQPATANLTVQPGSSKGPQIETALIGTSNTPKKLLKVIRPARQKNFEIEVPCSFRIFLSRVREELYPISNESSQFRLVLMVNHQWSWEIKESKPFGSSNLDRPDDSWNDELLSCTHNGVVFVVRDFQSIRVNDGTNQNGGTRQWNTSMPENTGELMSSLAGISQELLGRDPRRANAPIQLQVDRYKDEWLYWEMHYMDPVEFMREVFWKIDDAIINIYPVGWDQRRTFEASERERLPTGEQDTQDTTGTAIMRELNNDIEQNERGPPQNAGRTTGLSEPTTRGGPDSSSLEHQVPTASEVERLNRRIIQLEHQVLQRQERCPVCDESLDGSSPDEVADHFRGHRSRPELCPHCQQDWTETNRQHRLHHLATAHQPRNPSQEPEGPSCPWDDCPADFADRNLFPDHASRRNHVRTHVNEQARSVICTANGCNAELGNMSTPMQREHQEMHERAAAEARRLEQENERLKSELAKHTSRPRSHPPVIPGPAPRSAKAPASERYCPVCLAKLHCLSEEKRIAHLQKCKISADQMLHLTRAEFKQEQAKRKTEDTAAKNGTSGAIPPHTGAGADGDTNADEGPSNASGPRKKKTATKPKPPAPDPDENNAGEGPIHMTRSRKRKASSNVTGHSAGPTADDDNAGENPAKKKKAKSAAKHKTLKARTPTLGPVDDHASEGPSDASKRTAPHIRTPTLASADDGDAGEAASSSGRSDSQNRRVRLALSEEEVELEVMESPTALAAGRKRKRAENSTRGPPRKRAREE